MAFNNSGKELAVLESKFQIYEELSKEMLDKLERAVATISENSNRISLILERHEARLDQTERNDQAILKLIEKIDDRITELEKKVEGFIKFRWMAVGIGMAAVMIIQSSEVIIGMLTPNQSSGTVERTSK
jgi:septation ring formation regulator EzrA